MSSTTIVKIETPELSLLPKDKSKVIKDTFQPMVKMLEGFEEKYNEILKKAAKGIDEQVVLEARRARIDISKVRIETEKLRKAEKAES